MAFLLLHNYTDFILLYFKRGEIVNKTVGLISPADLENAIAKSK